MDSEDVNIELYSAIRSLSIEHNEPVLLQLGFDRERVEHIFLTTEQHTGQAFQEELVQLVLKFSADHSVLFDENSNPVHRFRITHKNTNLSLR